MLSLHMRLDTFKWFRAAIYWVKAQLWPPALAHLCEVTDMSTHFFWFHVGDPTGEKQGSSHAGGRWGLPGLRNEKHTLSCLVLWMKDERSAVQHSLFSGIISWNHLMILMFFSNAKSQVLFASWKRPPWLLWSGTLTRRNLTKRCHWWRRYSRTHGSCYTVTHRDAARFINQSREIHWWLGQGENNLWWCRSLWATNTELECSRSYIFTLVNVSQWENALKACTIVSPNYLCILLASIISHLNRQQIERCLTQTHWEACKKHENLEVSLCKFFFCRLLI